MRCNLWQKKTLSFLNLSFLLSFSDTRLLLSLRLSSSNLLEHCHATKAYYSTVVSLNVYGVAVILMGIVMANACPHEPTVQTVLPASRGLLPAVAPGYSGTFALGYHEAETAMVDFCPVYGLYVNAYL